MRYDPNTFDPDVHVYAYSAAKCVFPNWTDELSSVERIVFALDVYALWKDMSTKDVLSNGYWSVEMVDELQAAYEMRDRLGGIKNLRSYVDCLMVGSPDADPWPREVDDGE
jgi:hypothetical protein